MRAKVWIIIGFIGIAIGIIAPVTLWSGMMKDIQSAGPFSGSVGRTYQSMPYMMMVGAISQIFFWGGIIFTIFGFIKFYKE